MNQRYLIWGAVAFLVLLLLVLRWSCRGSKGLPEGDSLEARMERIDIMRQRQHAGDVQRLVDLAQGEAGSVRSAAVFALAEFKSSAAVDALKQMLQSGNDSALRAAAAEGLGRNGKEIPRLMNILAHEEDAAVRIGAARGLVSYSTTERREALPTFLAALRDEDAEVRKWAMRGITAISKKRFLYEPDKPPKTQAQRIAFIEQRMRQLNLLD